jgi:hypothetical protein
MTGIAITAEQLCVALRGSLWQSPLLVVIAVSIVIGFVMVIVFRYTSNQKAIARAKDQLKAHLLAVRLYQDQLPVVVRSYGRIFRATGTYLRLAFAPFLITILPIVFLIVQLDRYLGWAPVPTNQAFLLEARVQAPDALNTADLQLPAQLTSTAPPVHVPGSNEIIWRLVANDEGRYSVNVLSSGHTMPKQVVVGNGLSRLSPVRLKDNLWERMLSSAEPALPADSPVRSISVLYPSREISVAGWQMNWIVVFFIVSLIAGYIFKTVLGIQI